MDLRIYEEFDDKNTSGTHSIRQYSTGAHVERCDQCFIWPKN
jgi:hypothetical protein